MIGQDELIKIINEKTMDTFPHSVILSGDIGCGKHTLVNYISNKFNLNIVDITNNLNFEYLSELYFKVEPYIYLIDGDRISEREQNSVLKFVEEPLKNSFIVIITSNINNLLITIQNRCIHYAFAPYSRDTLKQFTDNESVLEYATTPGQVIAYENVDLSPIIELCNKILEKVNVANFANVLSIVDKINFADDSSKIDINLFVKIMRKVNMMYYIKNSHLTKYLITDSFINDFYIPNINKQVLFENYLTKMKQVI